MRHRITSFNANGLRSAAQKGFFDWLSAHPADVLALQEIKAQEADLTAELFYPPGYHRILCPAVKKGYSGVAIYTREQPLAVQKGLGFELCDNEGRYVHCEFESYVVASVYFPSGTSGEHRQVEKYKFMAAFFDFLKDIKSSTKPYILCGDWNIAHQPIDLKNWKANQKNSGFLPEERAWLTRVLDELGYVDAYRILHPDTENYTWWSHRGRAREKNVGWRIDYQITSPALKNHILESSVFPTPFFSDHAPLEVIYQL